MTKHYLAKWLHDNYESLAKEKNWQTQENCKVEFDNLPSENKELMLSLADRLQKTFLIIVAQASVSGMSSLIHHCGNELTEKEIFHDHCLKCSEYISED